MGREHYEEMHEREWDPAIEDKPEVDYAPSNCPTCKHDEYCPGGCKKAFSPTYKFEEKKEEYK